MKKSIKTSLIIIVLALVACLACLIWLVSRPDEPDELVGESVSDTSGGPSFSNFVDRVLKIRSHDPRNHTKLHDRTISTR